jgi:hypothetical protein
MSPSRFRCCLIASAAVNERVFLTAVFYLDIQESPDRSNAGTD